ncbi:hypothetical protein GWK16_10430 [Roseomonas sp. JC162]|uniref:DUF5666 domain-containing protein n=1 Tax=Neoroseomonas marina TaxID=1232220 RepID=A0A848EEA1_9PROT|nr:hypothetical protein [Neoroseomonas marina]NMJ41658.1 hypothetical protein [Neoroseomonas marina]
MRIARRSLAMVGLATLLAGCVPPTPPAPPPSAAEPPPSLPALGSIAAAGTVQLVDTATRQVLVRMTSGGTLHVSPPDDYRGLGSLQPGTRVIVEYDSRGVGHVALAARRGPRDRIRATVREIQRGGQHIDLASSQGTTQIFEVPDRSMMAFVTRLRAGDEVAITVLDQR